MLTVIICTKSTQPFIDRYKALFERYEEENRIAFCFWDDHGTDASSILPEIQNIVHGYRTWRAVVAIPLEESSDSALTREDNPFDYLSEASMDVQTKDSEIPIVRLSWILDDVPQVTHTYESDSVISKDDLKVHSYNRKQDIASLKQQQEVWEELHDKYALRCEPPVEILFVKGRKRPVRLFPKARDSKILERHEIDSSMFWFRNRYGVRSRFIIQDSASFTQSRYGEDLFRFWMGVLTLSLSDFASGTLEAEKVYRVEPVIELDDIQGFYSRYYQKLLKVQTSAFAEIEEAKAMGHMKRRSDELPDYSQKVTLNILKYDNEDLYLKENQIGLTTDVPIMETEWLHDASTKSLAELKKIKRFVRVALDQGGRQARYLSEVDDHNVYEMDEFQFDDMCEDLNDLEQEILSSDTERILPFKSADRYLRAQKASILGRMYQRMNRSNALMVFCICLVLFLVGFIPVVSGEIRNRLLSGDIPVLFLFVLMLAVFVSVLSLYIYRRDVVKRIAEYNKTMRDLMASVNSANDFFTEYLSRCATYMKGRAIQQKLMQRSQISSARVSRLNEHVSQLEMRLDMILGWLNDFDMKVLPEVKDPEPFAFDFDIPPEENPAYGIPREISEPMIEVADGQKMTAPLPFISGLQIERESVYEYEEAPYT